MASTTRVDENRWGDGVERWLGALPDLQRLLPGFGDLIRTHIEQAMARAVVEALRTAADELERAVQPCPSPPAPPTARPLASSPAPARAAVEAPKIVAAPVVEATPPIAKPKVVQPTQAMPPRPAERVPETSAPPPRRLVCPGCGAAGPVRFERTAQLFSCKKCNRLYRLHPDGRWTDIRSAKPRAVGTTTPKKKATKGRRLSILTPAAAVTAPALLLICLWWLLSPRATAAPQLPSDLDPRAEMLTRAWLKGDRDTMQQLTSTTHDRVLYAWLVRNQPPTVPMDYEPGQVEVRVLDRKPHEANLAVLLRDVPGSTAGRPVEMRQHWVERENIWFFVPPELTRRTPGR